MKTIGLIGGTSFESTVTYYQILNKTVNKALGGHHSAKCILYSVDFADIERNVSADSWDEISDILIEAATTLEKAGADFIIICTNTLHKLVPQIKEKISIPILHIAEATADKIIEKDLKKIALLGTKPTMTHDFYKNALLERGIEVLVPSEKDIDLVDSTIFDELCRGVVKEESKKEYLRIIEELCSNGAEGVILGCTEIYMLVSDEDVSIPVFDTTVIHAEKAVEKALEK